MAAVLVACLSAAALLGSVDPAIAHEGETHSAVVVDTDLGLDDVVALAMILQNPDLEVIGAVAGEGVADAATAAKQLARLVSSFNRSDITVSTSPARPEFPAPAFRQRASTAVAGALAEATAVPVRAFSARAYLDEPGHRSTVLALGPLTRIAMAFAADPELGAAIDRIVISGDPENPDDWNLSADVEALEAVRKTGAPLVFVRPGTRGGKPDTWYTDHLVGGQHTALGEGLLDRLLADEEPRTHYLAEMESFHDELAVVYLTRPDLFTEVGNGVFEPEDTKAIAAAIADALSRGRQRKDRVVFLDGPLPAGVLREDVRARRETILAANGPDEWFAQLLLNELHEHLGAYSIIGVKMGLRAAELLNAPQHAMTVVSATPAEQPVSCLNDGLLVSTGSTPGRGLFSHSPGPPGTVEASFTFNQRTVKLRLKEQYRTQIRSAIRGLLSLHTLEDDEYWSGVRVLGLDIWQDWHRRDLFEVAVHDRFASSAGKEAQP